MRSKRFILLLVLAHVIGIFLIKRFFSPRPSTIKAPFKKPKMEIITVKAAPVKRRDMDFILYYAGSLKAENEVNIYSKVNGKLLEYLAGEGDAISKDQLIALIDRDETGLKYEPARVESAVSGIVGRTFLDKGENVIAQSTPVAVVVDMDIMLVRPDIAEADIPYIQKGQKALLKVDAYPEEIFEGEVIRISQVMDLSTRTLPVEIALANADNRLKSGMFARISIFAGNKEDILTVPEDALVREDSFSYVYTVGDSQADKVNVKTGIIQDNDVEILEGLEGLERVIVFGHRGLKDKAKVNVIE